MIHTNFNYMNIDFMENIYNMFNEIYNNKELKNFCNCELCISKNLIYLFNDILIDNNQILFIIFQYKEILNRLQNIYLELYDKNMFKNEQEMICYSNLIMKYKNITSNIYFEEIINYYIIEIIVDFKCITFEELFNLNNNKIKKIKDIENLVVKQIDNINVNMYFDIVIYKNNHIKKYKLVLSELIFKMNNY